jgi:hypothetical protein
MPPRQPPIDRIADALERIAVALEARNVPFATAKIEKVELPASSVGTMLNPVTKAVHCEVCGLFAAVAEKHCMRRDCPAQEKP